MTWPAALILAVALLLGLVSLAGFLLFGWGMLWWLTALWHAFKPEEPPGPNDSDWSRDQGREAGRR